MRLWTLEVIVAILGILVRAIGLHAVGVLLQPLRLAPALSPELPVEITASAAVVNATAAKGRASKDVNKVRGGLFHESSTDMRRLA